ncbi:hypothetical protein [Hymenobacter sp. 102]|uniref:chryseobasin-related MNIO class RiPP peptide n=1 Tax=Hymenobacter sp. 102 TaxID=3403152 RepID=UPI003CFB3856
MKLSKVLLSALAVGLATQATSCNSNDDPKPKDREGEKTETVQVPDNCPACGRG